MTRTARFALSSVFATFVLTPFLFGQSWNSSTGDFNGTGDFSATENADPWVGPTLLARNGGELTFAGDVTHNGSTRVETGSAVIVNGAFDHTNSFQTFSVGGNDGQGGFSSLTIGDAANSDVTSADFSLQYTGLNLNSVSAANNVLLRNGSQLDILQDFSSGGRTIIETGSQVTVGGAFNHTNSFQTFSIGGDDGQGGFSSLTIGDAANSNVTSADFSLQYTGLNLNSASASNNVLIRNGAQLDIIQDFSSGGRTIIETGSKVNVGGAFNHTNSFQTFSIGGDDGQGGFSSLTIGDAANSNVTSADFSLQYTGLNLNSASAANNVLIRNGAQLDIAQDFSSGGRTIIETGSQVNVGGAFNHTNSFQTFSIGGDDGQGGFSSLTIGDAAKSNVSSNDFSLQYTELNLNSASADRNTLIRNGAQLEIIQNFSAAGAVQVESGSQVNIGGDFSKINQNQNFSVGGADDFGNRSSFQVGGTVDIEARSFTSSGKLGMSGDVKSAISAIFFNGTTIAPGLGVGELNIDTNSVATQDHGLQIQSDVTYQWELGTAGNDVINVVGDLQLSDNWELELITLDDSFSNIQSTDRFDVFTYTGQLTAFVDGSGEMTRVRIDDSGVDVARWDTSQVAVYDDGAGVVYLTGLSFIAVPEPGSMVVFATAFAFVGLRRRKQA